MKMADNKDRDNFFSFMAGLGANSFKDFMSTKEGKEKAAKIISKILGIGLSDEALFEKSITFLLNNILKINGNNQQERQERKEIRKKINRFINDLKENGYSWWWFRNVLAKMREGDKDNSENQAAQTLADIITANDFEEAKEIISPALLHKTYISKISEGWEVVVDRSGGLILLFDRSKFSNFIQPKIQTAKADMKKGFIQTLIWFWSGVGALAIIFLLVYLYN
jgi:hypothetical protein